jgi:rSAM/selenodomain-associated transferase 1
MNSLGSIEGVDTFIAFAPTERRAFFDAFGLCLLPLPSGDLGERMLYAFREVFSSGYKKAALVGVDIPDLSPRIVTKAFGLLSEHDVVFGPARDGGYYLVGIKEPLQELFTDIPWSSETTLDISVQRARHAGRSVSFTETLSDIDTIEDVKKAGFHL